MIALFVNEFRQIWRYSITWTLLFLMLFTSLFFYAQMPEPFNKDNPTLSEGYDNFEPIDYFTILDADFTVAPDYMETFNASKTLIAESFQRNQNNQLVRSPEKLAGPASITYKLLSFTQSGLLILASLAFGLLFSKQSKSPSKRKTSISRGIIAKSLALTLTLALIFILPKLLAMLGTIIIYGRQGLDLIIPFNPLAGAPLFEVHQGTASDSIILTTYRGIISSSLVSLGRIYAFAFFYELSQILVWTALGLLLADLMTKKFLVLGTAALLLLTGRAFAFPNGDQGIFRYLFFSYTDALRDTLGSPFMMRGLTINQAPFDYFLGMMVLLLTGILILYLTQLRYQGKLSFQGRGGEDDEDL